MTLPLLLLLQSAQAGVPDTLIHTPRHYEVTLVPADTGTHLLGEAQTSWTLRSTGPVAALLDSNMRVVRVLVDGRPNTRLSRTMYGRSGEDVVVPHQKSAGDSISTRIRYHGLVAGDAWIGDDRGSRAFVAGGWNGAHHWLPVPPGPSPRVTATFHVEAPVAHRVLANGVLTRVDTLPYGHAAWHYRLEAAAPVRALAVAVGEYTVTRAGAEVEVWTRPADSARAAAGQFRRAGDFLERLTAMLGPLPYPRLVHAAAPGVPAVSAGGGLALYPAESLSDGGVTEAAVARATARQWFDGADSTLADELSAWLAADLLGGAPPREPRRIAELHARAGEARFREGLRAFVRSQREGRGGPADLAAAVQQGR